MANRKVRRRREKLKRHDYELVIETDEGEEVPFAPERTRPGKPADGKKEAVVVNRHGRPVPKPSFARVAKRTAIFGPIILVLIWITGAELTTAQKISQALILLLFFIPFSYMVDVLMYRAFRRRQEKQGAAKG
jgi:hypothetical protein